MPNTYGSVTPFDNYTADYHVDNYLYNRAARMQSPIKLAMFAHKHIHGPMPNEVVDRVYELAAYSKEKYAVESMMHDGVLTSIGVGRLNDDGEAQSYFSVQYGDRDLIDRAQDIEYRYYGFDPKALENNPAATPVPQQLVSDPNEVSVGNLAYRFGKGVVGGLVSIVTEPILQVHDMALAGSSVFYNEVLKDDNESYWFPDMKSGVGNAAEAGESHLKLILASNPITGVGVLTYDGTTAAMEGRWGDVAEMSGGVAAGMVFGKAMDKYGKHRLVFEEAPMVGGMGRKQAGNLGGRIKLKAPEEITTTKSGDFSISDWDGYPEGVPKPDGPFRLVEGAEYNSARKAANAANNKIRQDNNLRGKPVDVHEIKPVKFGGSPTDPANKIIIDRGTHRQKLTPWWNKLQKDTGG